MSSLFGSDSSTSSSTSKTQKTEPGWISQPQQSLVSQAMAQLGVPYQAYTGQQVANFTPDQLQAQGLYQNLVGGTNQAYNTAQGITQQVANYGLNGPTQNQINQYMNPYTTNVLNAQNAMANQQFDQQKSQLAEQQAQTGAFGGSRSAIAQGQLYQNFALQQNQSNATGLSNAYNSALSNLNQGMQTAGQSANAMLNQANSQQSMQMNQANALAQSGATQQQQSQAQLNVPYQNYLNAQQYPYQQMQFASGIINPIATDYGGQTSSSTSTQTPGNSGILGALGGIGSTLLGLPGVGSSVGSLLSSGLGSLFGGQNITSPMVPNNYGSSNVGVGDTNVVNNGGNTISTFREGGMVGYRNGGQVNGYANGGSVTSSLSDMISQFMQGLYNSYYPNNTSTGNVNTAPTSNIYQQPEQYGPINPNQLTAPGGPTYGQQQALWANMGKPGYPMPQDMDGNPSQLNPPAGPYDSMIENSAQQRGIPVNLAKQIMYKESSDNPNAISSKGAVGLGQINPITAKQLGLSQADLLNPKKNIDASMTYLSTLNKKYNGDWAKTLAAYNMGPTALANKGMDNLPTETSNYLTAMGINGYRKGGIVGYADGGSVSSLLNSFADYYDNNVNPFANTDSSGQGPAYPVHTSAGQPKAIRAAEGIGNIPTYVGRAVRNAFEGLGAAEQDFGNWAFNTPDYTKDDVLQPNAASTINSGPQAQAFFDAQQRVLTDAHAAKAQAAAAAASPTPKPEVAKAVTNLIAQMHGSDPAAQPATPSSDPTADLIKNIGQSTGSSSNNDDKGNLPLMAFGASLLSSDKNFFHALGGAGQAYVTTTQAQAQQARELAANQAKMSMDQLNAALHAQQTQAYINKSQGTANPWTQAIENLKAHKMLQDLQGGNDYAKSRDMIFGKIMSNGLEPDPDKAMAQASKMAMSLKVSGQPPVGDGATAAALPDPNLPDFSKIKTQDDLTNLPPDQLPAFASWYQQNNPQQTQQ